MLKVLINAYACSPGIGSEPGMAWNWVKTLAKFCELYIINMHFYYNPVSDEIRKMCWNQGDWRFYKYYRQWQWKTYLMAKDICETEKIDVLHQLNMIGFREPGYLWKLSKENGVPFVWGPIGGLKQFPTAYLKGSGLKMQLFMRLKNFLNIWQLKHEKRVGEALKTAKLLISSIPDSYRALKKYKGLESMVIPETGCFLSDDISTDRFDDEEFHIMWVGKFDFRKQLPLALQAVALAKNPKLKLDVYGSGFVGQVEMAKRMGEELGISQQVIWHGNQKNDVIMEAMRKAQLFFFTSVNEDTSTVVLEAVSNRLPVVCFNACGMSAVIDDSVGRKIALSHPSQSAHDFARILNELESNRALLKHLSENCKQRQMDLSWEVKARMVVEEYEKIIGK